jgi:hypothetical protein
MIKNYRLHVVRDPVNEGITKQVKSLFELNKGTSIPVSNSILKPEKHKFSTRVQGRMEEMYPVLKGEYQRFKAPEKFDSESGDDIEGEDDVEAPLNSDLA